MDFIHDKTEVTKVSAIRQSIIDECLVLLGYPVVTLFVTEEQISKMIDIAVRKCASKACPRFLATRTSCGKVIDVSDLNVETVSYIYSGDLNGSGCSDTDGCDICSKLCSYRWYGEMTKGDWNNQMYDVLAFKYAQAEIQKQILPDWYLDGNLLYLDNYEGVITIEYTKNNITLEDLQNDSFWVSWIESYTIALTKITEGRIRSKYKLSSGVFEVESDELISEGNTDKQDLEEKLNEYIGYWNVL